LSRSLDPDLARTRIAHIRDQYFESASRIERFLFDAEKGFEMVESFNAGIAGRLRAAEAGKPIPPPTGSETVEVELTLEEVDVLASVLEEAGALMAHYPGMLAEMSLMYLIATFEAFLSDLLFCLLTARPEILKSSRQITFQDVIEASSRDELIADLALKEINSWTYLSFADQATWLADRLGISLATMGVDQDAIGEAYARRNLLAHRGGVVDQRYLELASGSQAQPGERLESNTDYWAEVANALHELAGGLVTEVSGRCLGPPK
jgi:hypothetical protein